MRNVINSGNPEKMSEINKSSSVDIEFQDLGYVIKGRKSILKSINGKCHSGELTAILGASGSGKTTLMNILAGYISTGVTGSITVNGLPRNMKILQKLTAYIMQEDLLQPCLSVEEMMMIAAKLKLGDGIRLPEKSLRVTEVLKLLGLENCLKTRSEDLSGGERKRLSIALEMVGNPLIIFLDEPTSGLDTVAANQCLNILQNLTEQGRTVICTIHQPSASMLQQFNQVYFLQDGLCVYNGSTSNIIPFMSSLGYECPVTYNPADYIVETVQIIQESVATLTAAIQNGKINLRDFRTETHSHVLERRPNQTTQINVGKMDAAFSTTFCRQFCIILSRMILQIKRNKIANWIQLFHHTFCGALFGLVYYGIGNNASKILSSLNYCVGVLLFFIYTHTMIPVLLFPTELQLLSREHFNRWYDLKPYFLALTLRSLPNMVFLGLLFVSITYLLTNQPLELYRFVGFATVAILTALVSEAQGLVIGSTCNITNGSVLGCAVGSAEILLCMYGTGYGNQINPVMKNILNLSYLRVGMIGAVTAIFGDRSSLDCFDEILCYYQEPKDLLRDLGMYDASYGLHILGLIIFLVVFRLSAFLALKYRLTSKFS